MPDYQRQISASTAVDRPKDFIPMSIGDSSYEKGKPPKSIMRRKWDRAVQTGRWARVTYGAVGLVLLIIWLAVMLGFARALVANEQRNSQSRVSNIGTSAFVMKGTLVKFDPIERNLKVNWGLSIIENGALVPVNPKNGFAVGVWRDLGAVPEDRPNVTVIDELSTLFRVDNVTQAPLGILGQHEYDSISTDIDFNQKESDSPFRQPSFGYPFDQWVGSIVFIGNAFQFAASDNISNAYVIPLEDVALTDSTLNWKISVNTSNPCPVEGALGCELHVDFLIQRPGLVRFSALVAVIVNWTSTIGIFFLTCEAIIMRRHHILRDTDILGVCLTALFALPSVRAILPGAPEFGALNLVGIIPNVIIISICTTMFAISKLRLRPEKEE